MHTTLAGRKKTGGRNADGRITTRGRGGGAKQKIRNVDFRRRYAREKYGPNATVVATVIAIGRYRMPSIPLKVTIGT